MVSEHPSPLKVWLIAIRPFALPASAMPVIFGSVAAVVLGNAELHIFHFILSLIAMVLLHSGANMLSDVTDFKKGLDTEPTPVSGAVVRGLLSQATVLRGGALFLIIGSLIGIYLVTQVGLPLLIIGILGLIIGIFYTIPPLELKYRALGDWAVFLDFGILGATGAWIVQTNSFSWLPVLWAIPIGLLVIAILHANNWRDAASDTRVGIRTIAAILGDKGSLVYYGFLLILPYVLVALCVFGPRTGTGSLSPLPYSALAVLLSVPNALTLWRRACSRHAPRTPLDFIALDGATAQHNLLFGILYIAGILGSLLIR